MKSWKEHLDHHTRKANSHWGWALVYGVIVVVVLYILYQLFSIVRTMFSSINSGVASIFGTPQARQDVANSVLPTSFWSPQFASTQAADGADLDPTGLLNNPDSEKVGGFMGIGGTVVPAAPLINKIIAAVPWYKDYDLSAIVAVFNQFTTQTQFANFCAAWSAATGTNLAVWLKTGYLSGWWNALSDTDFETLNSIIAALPVS